MAEVFTGLDENQSLRASYSDTTQTFLFSDGFLLKKVGRKIDVTYPSATSEVYTFKEGATTLLAITVTYTDSAKTSVSSTERTA